MDLRQELTRTPSVDDPRPPLATLGSNPVDEVAVDTIAVVEAKPERTRPDAPSHLAAVRREAPLARRPGDRLLRLVDVFGALVGLVIAVPIMLIAGPAIRASSRGPVLYSQDRIGRDGATFRCRKLRTMRRDAEHELRELLDHPGYVAQWDRDRKLERDPRVTSVGRFLRSTDLDELPQLWNVLRGEMSLVGPRPVPADEAERYGANLVRVLSIRPGMTGLWQVGGRHRVSYDERIALDVRYVESRNVSTNLRVILRTVGLIVTRRNGAC